MPPPRIPSLNWLRVFEAAARSGSFARASEHLNMSAPAVSQQIRALEGYLGRDLFVRGPRSVHLTESGRAFLPVVAQSLHSVEVATANLFGDAERVPLGIVATHLLAAGWLARRLPGFQAAHPQVQVSVLSAISAFDYRNRDADLAITFGVPPLPGEESDPLFGEILTPVAPREIAEQILTPADLAKFPLVEIATHRANWFALLPNDGPDPRFTYTDSTLTAFSLAADGAIALDRAPASEGLAATFGLVPCLPGLSISGVEHYALIYNARSALRAPARAFRNWLLDEASQERSAIESASPNDPRVR